MTSEQPHETTYEHTLQTTQKEYSVPEIKSEIQKSQVMRDGHTRNFEVFCLYTIQTHTCFLPLGGTQKMKCVRSSARVCVCAMDEL